MDARNGGVGFSIRHLQIQSGDVLFIDRTQEPDYELSQFCRRSDFDLTPTERHAYNIPRWIQNR